ncbi:hypothetical protein BT69DRAFT_1224851 [Atractiella rhizophila]|nr:hypothetical protein BT69DRAFT_1224851 [Atractiella rhizophila]
MLILLSLGSFIFSSSLIRLSNAKAGIFSQIEELEKNGEKKLSYPTQFTQDIIPKFIHSHNDYWREVPLLTAVSYGATSVEADVWLLPGSSTLYVAHEPAAITPTRTFESLYLEPLTSMVAGQNPTNQAVELGVFDTSSGQTLQLLVDLKTAGNETMHAAVSALQPLFDKGYLTSWNGTDLVPGPITVIGTGNTNLAGVISLPLPRFYFLDAPLGGLNVSEEYKPELSPIASGSWKQHVGWNGIGKPSDSQLEALRREVGEAQGRGIKARYWECPTWPIRARDAVWNLLIDEGVDWINADDLEAAAAL